MHPRNRNLRGVRRTGVAMALVLLVIAIAVVLGVCFLSAATSSTPAAKLADQRLQARLVAESGLAAALTRLRRDASWRATTAEGVWFADASVAGGTFTVHLFDGEDTDGDGVVEGTANFADDPYAPVTVRVVATSGDAKHAVSAVYRPNQEGTLAVAGRLLMNGEALVDSYNSQQGPYGVAGNAGAAARASSNRVGGPNIRLADLSVLDGNVYFPRTADTSLAYSIAPTARMNGITGRLAADEWSIPPVVTPAYTRSAADSIWASGTAVDLTSDVVCRNFTVSGATKLKVVGNRRIICDGAFTVANTAEILLDNPKYGNLAATILETNANNKKQLATRFHIPDTVEVRAIAARIRKSGKQVRLGLYSDAAGKPDKLLVQGPIEDIVDDTLHWHESSVTSTTITPGFYWIALALDTGAPWYSYSVGGNSVSKSHDALAAAGFLATWGTVELWDTEITSMNIYLTGNSAGKGATLDVYSNRKVYVQDRAVVNRNTQMPSRLRVWHRSGASDSEVLATGSSVTYASMTAPDAILRLNLTASALGTFKARDILLRDTAVLRVDTAGGTIDPGIVVGETLDMTQNARLAGITGQAVVASCEAGSPVIRLKGTSQLKGDAYAGPGAAATAAHVMVEPNAVLSGERKVLASAVAMTTPAAPTFASLGAVNVTAGTYVLNADREATSLNVSLNGRLEVRGNVTLVVRGPVTLVDRGCIVLAPDGRLTLHALGPVTMRDDALVNDGGSPSKVTIYAAGGDDVDVQGRARLYGALHAPTSMIRMQNYAELFGNVVGRRVLMNDRTRVHYDRRPSRLRWSEKW